MFEDEYYDENIKDDNYKIKKRIVYPKKIIYFN